MTEPNTADTDTGQAPTTPAAMPPRLPGTEPATAAAAPSLDDSGMDPAAISEIRKLRRESQRLRERLHAAEEDAERAITQLDALQRREIERVAGEILIDGSDLWAHAQDAPSFLDEYGQPDPDVIAGVAAAIVADKPHLGKPPSGPPPTDRPIEGLRPGATPPREPTPEPSWQSVTQPHVGRRMGVAD